MNDGKIYFGFSAIKGLKEKVINNILDKRPFKSMLDFIVETGADITSIVALIKAGAFDSFNSRMDNIEVLSRLKADTKQKLNGQNFMMLARSGFWPQDTADLKDAYRVFAFTQYLKDINEKKATVYNLDDRCCAFLDEMGFQHNGVDIEAAMWKTYYDFMMRPMKQYLIDNQQEMLEKVNSSVINEWKAKYFANNDLAQWEIETMGLCFEEHPYKNIENIDRFEDLPQEPEIASIFRTKQGRKVPLFRLTMICGIVIAKDKLHSSITLLSADGPVEVKFRKEQFAHYDSQISKQVGGKKQIVERSWLNRGIGLIIHGMRQDDLFLAKTYKNSPMQHTAYKITGILPDGKFSVQKDRKKGKQEESDDNEE